MESNKIVNNQVDLYYKKQKQLLNSRSHSYTAGLNSKSKRTNEFITTNSKKDTNENGNADMEDDFDFDISSKKRHYSISNGNKKEAMMYEKQLPKQVGRTLSALNDSYDDLTKIEHKSILNEMRYCYISFTSKLDIFEGENELNLVHKNFQEPNRRETHFVSTISSNKIDINEDNEENFTEGISFKPVPVISTNEIISVGDIGHEDPELTEELLKHIEHDAIITINKSGDTDSKNDNNKNDNNDNDTIDSDNNSNISIGGISNNKSKTKSVNIDIDNSVSSLSTNHMVKPRRKSSVFSLFQRNKRNSSSYSQYSINSAYTNTSKLSFKDTSASQMFNISERSNLNIYVSPNYNNDINDILSIGATSPIVEESLMDISKKKKSKKNKNEKINSIINNSYNINEVFKRPNIELIGRISCENNVINNFIAEKLRNVLPPYYRECQKWKLVYSVIDHGSSITTLLNMCEETTLTGSFLLGILDTEGYVYGAFLSENIHTYDRFYGSGECFLWKFNNETREIDYYRGSVENLYHIATEKTFIAFGGGNGDFGLYISGDLLNGYTTYCPTYNNPPLTPNGKFECLNIELWGFDFSS